MNLKPPAKDARPMAVRYGWAERVLRVIMSVG